MSFGGSVAAMISSLKTNNRRKPRSSIYDKDNAQSKRGKPIQSKEYTQFEKDLLLKELKENR